MLRYVGSLDRVAGFSGEWNTLSILGGYGFVARGVWVGAPGSVNCLELVDTSVVTPGAVTTSIGTGMGTICITGCGLVSGVEVVTVVNPEGSFCSLCDGCVGDILYGFIFSRVVGMSLAGRVESVVLWDGRTRSLGV